jgi:oligosaccharide repeat unit polymerase
MYFFFSGKNDLLGMKLSESMYIQTELLYLVCMILLQISYWISIKYKVKNNSPNIILDYKKARSYIVYLFILFFSILLINNLSTGLSFRDFFKESEEGFRGFDGATNYFQSFSDSIIIVLIAAYFFKVKKNYMIIMLILSITLFLLLGFRYRIIFLLIGYAFVFVIKNDYSIKLNFKKLFLFSSLSLLVILFISQNRYSFTNGKFNEIEINPLKYDFELIFNQTRGFLADAVIVDSYLSNTQNKGHDFGETMFAYPFYMMIPRFIFHDKDKLYPSPQIAIQMSIYSTTEAKVSGEALLNLGYLMISFGIFGITVGSFLFGYFIAKVEKFHRKNKSFPLFYMAFALCAFQWITRGYIPQIVTLFIYLYIPIFLLKRTLIRTTPVEILKIKY